MAEIEPSRYLDDSTYASDPGGLTLSHDKLREMRPDLYGFAGAVESVLGALRLTLSQKVYLKEALYHGDSRAAVVVSTSPLLVAAYTDELDCIALLRFPDELVEQYGLKEGTGLLTVNTYAEDDPTSGSDLIRGPEDTGNWAGFHPLIADFVSDDSEAIQQRKQEIAKEEWKRAYLLGKQYLSGGHGSPRDGRPGFAAIPANLIPEALAGIRAETRRAQLIGGTVVVALGLFLLCSGILALGRPGGRANAPGPVGPPPGAMPGEFPGGMGEEVENMAAEHQRRFDEIRERSRRTREEAQERMEEARQRQANPPPTSEPETPSGMPAAAGLEATESSLRTWTDSTGEHRTEAEFVGLSGTDVKLKTPDGRLLTLSLDKLSQADQDYVQMRSIQPRSPDPIVEEPTASEPAPLFAETPLSIGDKLLAEWAGRWLDVEVLALVPNGDVKIHWDGYGPEWDEIVPRSRLRLPNRARTK